MAELHEAIVYLHVYLTGVHIYLSYFLNDISYLPPSTCTNANEGFSSIYAATWEPFSCPIITISYADKFQPYTGVPYKKWMEGYNKVEESIAYSLIAPEPQP